MSTTNDRASRIRASLEARRAGIRSNLAARRQSLAQGLIRDLSELIPGQIEPPTLRREEPRGGIPAARGVANYNYQPGTGETTGGIASPLTEGAAADADPEDPSSPFLARESYPAQVVASSDGLFVWEVTPPAIITFRDNNGEPAQVRLANPYASEE